MSTRPSASIPLPGRDHESTLASLARLEEEDPDLQQALRTERRVQPIQLRPATSGMEHGDRRRSRRRRSLSEKEVVPKAPTCTICTEVKEIEGLLKPCRRCQELWCHGCIRTLFIGATWDSDRMPARCCHKLMHHGIAKGIVDDQELAIYKLRYEEFCTPKPFYCPTPTCSKFLSPRLVKAAQQDQPLACPDCCILICTKCRQTANPAHECPEVDSLLTTVRNLKYKICPKCGTGVRKLYGCDHVRCRCGAHWCWACERSIDRCNLDPCPLSLEYGDGGAYDTDDDDDDDTVEADDQTSVAEPTSSVTNHQSPSAGAADLRVQDRAEAAVASSSNISLGSVSLAGAIVHPAADTIVEIDPPALPTASADASTTSLPENLDDPNEHDWDCQDLDLGEEPADEAWEVWGCVHRFRRFEQEDMLEKWVKPEALECQTCFELVRPHGDLPARNSRKRARSDTEERELSVHTGNSDVLQERSNLPELARRRSGKLALLALECKKCGAFFCQECRAGVKNRYNSETDTRQPRV